MTDVLEFDSVELSFGARRILSSIYMKCCVGEVVGLLGRNGCGKSSLMKILFGTLKADFKNIRINDLKLTDNYFRNRVIAYLPQENLIPPFITIEKAFHLYRINLESIYETLPQLHEFRKLKPQQLSGGYLRLIEVLLILKSPAHFCILDEPFSGLMPLYIEKLITLIVEEKSRKGIIITDHMHRHVISLSDRLYILANGKTHLVNDQQQLISLGYVNHL